MAEQIVDATPEGGTVLAELDTPRGAVTALGYGDGAVRLRHTCKLVGGDLRVVCAPALVLEPGGHTVASREPLTVSPSVGCYDCGLHGFIRDGVWSDAGTPPL